VTGTKDKDYNLLWFTQACLDNALRLEQYIQDAEQTATRSWPTCFGELRRTAARAPSWARPC
jgi:hypothetical protein